MSHPTPEEWMSFLYDEDSPERHAECHAHMQACATCSARVRVWREGMKALDEWLSPPRRSAVWFRPVLNWAAAAAVVLGIGFSLGRVSSQNQIDAAALKASMARDLDQKVALALQSSGNEVQRLLAEVVKVEERRRADQEAMLATLHQLEARYANGLATLRKELETVAVNTEDGLLETHQQLGMLASYAQPRDVPPK